MCCALQTIFLPENQNSGWSGFRCELRPTFVSGAMQVKINVHRYLTCRVHLCNTPSNYCANEWFCDPTICDLSEQLICMDFDTPRRIITVTATRWSWVAKTSVHRWQKITSCAEVSQCCVRIIMQIINNCCIMCATNWWGNGTVPLLKIMLITSTYGATAVNQLFTFPRNHGPKYHTGQWNISCFFC